MTGTSDARRAPSPVGRLPMIFLMLGLMGIGMGQSILFAVLPPAAREVGLNEYQVAAIIAGAAFVFVIGSPIWGRIADRFSRKPVIVTGLLGYGLTTILFAWFLDQGLSGLIAPALVFYCLAGARILYAVLSSGVVPASQALMADATSPEKRMGAIAGVQAAFGMGMILGPGIVPIFIVFGLAAPLYVAGGVSVLTGLIVWARLREIRTKINAEAAAKASRIRLKDPRIRPYLVLALLFFICVAGIQQIAAFVYQDTLNLTAEATASTVGIDLIVAFVAMILTQITAMRLKKIGVRPMLLLGLGFAAVSMGVFLFADVRLALTTAMIFFGMSIGCFSPAVVTGATLAVEEGATGAVAGYVASVQSAGYIFGPLLLAGLYRTDATFPFLFELGVYAVLAALTVFWLARNPLPASVPEKATAETA